MKFAFISANLGKQNIFWVIVLTFASNIHGVMRRLSFFLLPAIISLLLFSCKDDESLIPDCEVYVKTYTSEYNELRTANHAVLYPITGVYPSNFKLGYGGVAIFRDLEGKVGCCDLACPCDKSRSNPLTIQMPWAICPLCDSKFDLSYSVGNPVEGPATSGLRMYRNIRDTGDYILVTN